MTPKQRELVVSDQWPVVSEEGAKCLSLLATDD
jgi:hypothetical protein